MYLDNLAALFTFTIRIVNLKIKTITINLCKVLVGVPPPDDVLLASVRLEILKFLIVVFFFTLTATYRQRHFSRGPFFNVLRSVVRS